MPLEDVAAAFSRSLSNLKGPDIRDPEKLEEKLPEISKIANEVVDILADGWQWDDAASLGKLVKPVMEMAATITDYSGEQKKQFVVDALWLVYRTVDGGPDGTENRIDIPILFGSLERGLEKKAVSFAVEFAIFGLFDHLREQKLV